MAADMADEAAVRLTPDATAGIPVTAAYVHKVEASEVLLREAWATGDDTYRIRADWPRSHGFYTSRHGLHDPLLLAETVRQAVPLLSHAGFGAPFGHRQSWSSLNYALTPAALAVGEDDTEIELRVACRDVVRRAGRLASMNLQVEIVRDGTRVGTVRTRFANHPPALYERIRGPYADLAGATARALPPAPPVDHARVGREHPADVVLAASDVPGRSRLRVDLRHPVLFDHPVDHAPGMLLLEAARQAAQAVAHPRPVVAVGMDTLFTRYCELDAECWIHAGLLDSPDSGTTRAVVSLVQNDLCVFSGVITLREMGVEMEMAGA
ncbi:ScbA/BarX family gamma-butyrolactone biosynthesis protein [Streptomyces antibioticus]|uniref:ScbA/BarX family gamma-butyrolactone biosynthesis protein n=1 Tax=Streptomyces antibioticus TaxID=1890 RepID=UPI00371D22F5